MTDLLSDIDLLRDMRNGDKAAFTALYRRHHAAVYRYAVMRCASEALAADMLQEIFMGLLTGSLQYDPLKAELRYFLFGVARMKALKMDVLQNRFVQAVSQNDENEADDDVIIELASEEGNPLEKILSNQMAEECRLAIAHLAPHYRDVFILFELQELSYVEIAEICQISVGTVRSRLSRARAALVQRLSAASL